MQPVSDSENDRSIIKGIRMASGVPTAHLLSRPLRGANAIFRGQGQSVIEGEKRKASAGKAHSVGSGPLQRQCSCALTNTKKEKKK